MAQSTTRRTLHYYWQVTRKHKGLFWGLILSTFAFVALLSYGNPYVMSLVVDRVSEGGVGADEVFSAYGPYIVALIAINLVGQAASKLQDYTLYKLEISQRLAPSARPTPWPTPASPATRAKPTTPKWWNCSARSWRKEARETFFSL